MPRLVELIQNDTAWADIGLPDLYGTISVDTTDPASSNSGNMFAALLANVLNGGRTLTEENLPEILPQLEDIFSKLGYMETSSSDLFSQFLRMGIGAKPVIAGYESQLIEYAALYPEQYDAIKDDIIMLYPAPTVWSTMCSSHWMTAESFSSMLCWTKTYSVWHGKTRIPHRKLYNGVRERRTHRRRRGRQYHTGHTGAVIRCHEGHHRTITVTMLLEEEQKRRQLCQKSHLLIL